MTGDAPSAVVVGAGIVGASVAHALAGRGWTVTLVEQYSPAHARASSRDSSRVFRIAHGGEDPGRWYTQSAWHARELWLEIGHEEGVELLSETGVMWLARRDDGFETQSETTLADLGLPFQRLPAQAALEVFPDIAVDDLAFLLYEPHGGVLRATTCVHTLIRRAQRSGTELVSGVAVPIEGRATLHGQILGADRTIWACGSWLGALFPEHADVRPARQTLFYLGADAAWRTPDVPVWIDEDGDAYGHGDFDGAGFKAHVCSRQLTGVDLDPDRDSRLPDEAAEGRMRRYLLNRFPSLARAPVVAARVCQYELTPDRHFLVAPLPQDSDVWLVGGGSGHAFKHGPALGEYVADLLLGRREPRSEFAVGRRSDGALE